jgi:hypothetical protein
MPGVRVRHTTQRSVRFTVVESDRPYPEPLHCSPPEFGGCGSVHLFKTHHLNLDDTGSVIVGDTLFEKIRENLVANGFVIANEVARPPTMRVSIGPQREGAGTWGNIPIVRGEGS